MHGECNVKYIFISSTILSLELFIAVLIDFLYNSYWKPYRVSFILVHINPKEAHSFYIAKM
jgi:hypothetical protein